VKALTIHQPWAQLMVTRWAWLFDDLAATTEPIPCRGQQRYWQLPEEVADAIRAVGPTTEDAP
jgi:hypothetical protein